MSELVKVTVEIPYGCSAFTGDLKYNGEQRLALDGESQNVIIPVNTSYLRVVSENGDIRYACSGSASSLSAGYLPDGMVEYLSVTDSFSVYGLPGVYANIVFLKR